MHIIIVLFLLYCIFHYYVICLYLLFYFDKKSLNSPVPANSLFSSDLRLFGAARRWRWVPVHPNFNAGLASDPANTAGVEPTNKVVTELRCSGTNRSPQFSTYGAVAIRTSR